MIEVRKELPVISCHQISKSYAGRRVLSDVTLDVPTGLVTGLLGPNGAGKTTILKGLLGLTTMDEGTITAPDQRADGFDRTVGAALDICGFRSEMRLRDIVGSTLIRLGVSNTDPAPLLDRVGLTDHRQRVGSISQGMRQRLRVAMALAGRPQLLILDEPLNGLDPAGIVWLRHLIRGHADRGGAVLFSTHLLNEAEKIVDRVVVLSHGEVLASGSLENHLKGDQTLEDFFFGLTGRSGLQEES